MKSVMCVELVCRGEEIFSPATADVHNTQGHSDRCGDYASAGSHSPFPGLPHFPATPDWPFITANHVARYPLGKVSVSREYGTITRACAGPGLARVSGIGARFVTRSASHPPGG